MSIGLNDVYPMINVNFALRRKVKMTSTCKFVSLGDKMHTLLVKNGKEKNERKRKERNYLSHDLTETA